MRQAIPAKKKDVTATNYYRHILKYKHDYNYNANAFGQVAVFLLGRLVCYCKPLFFD